MRLPQIECNVLLDGFPTETTKAVQQLSSGKAPGVAAINAEVYAFCMCVCVGGYPCHVVSLYVEKGGYPARI